MCEPTIKVQHVRGRYNHYPPNVVLPEMQYRGVREYLLIFQNQKQLKVLRFSRRFVNREKTLLLIPSNNTEFHAFRG